ncbi:hypothetical protein JB92DRAFT_2846348 [Gautieria morchelliformis]|nr:hypothetical protein JB92DRAFT_2846348 [Gautieria morchelliformis]
MHASAVMQSCCVFSRFCWWCVIKFVRDALRWFWFLYCGPACRAGLSTCAAAPASCKVLHRLPDELHPGYALEAIEY